jgi:single-stranded DNA-binding protein
MFINCTSFDDNAVFFRKYFSSGKYISIIGKLNIDKVMSTDDGITRKYTEIIVKEQEFVFTKKEEQECKEVIIESEDIF